MEFRILGPLTVTVEGVAVPLGGPRQQSVLALLLLAQGEPVSSEELLDALYNGQPPPSAGSALYAYVSRLRGALGSAGPLVARTERGYVLAADPGTVDAWRFCDLVEAGLRLDAARPERVIEHLAPALGLWRAPVVLGSLRGEPWAEVEAARLEEQRAIAIDALADAELAAGRDAAAVLRLQQAVTEQPLREGTVERLMLALYRSGRQSDALSVYERCRRALADELGVDPSPPLRRMHAAVLSQSEGLVERPRATTRSVVRIPPRNPSFAARTELLADMESLARDQGTGSPRLVVLHGLGGVGKTQTALEFAHRHRPRYTVTWWVPAEHDSTVLSSLVELAQRRGIDVGPEQQDLLSALWDDVRTGGRWLLVFDNAEDPAHLEPYLPPAGEVDVLVTSRSPAWGRYGTPLQVTPFDRRASVDFLRSRSGTSDDDTAEALAEALGDLPLALEQACAYVEQTGLALEDYLELFRTRRELLISRGAPAGYGATVAAAWRLAFDRVEAESPLAARLLETCAFLAPDSIPLLLLGGLFPEGTADLEIDEAVAHLRRFSLVDRNRAALGVHRLVQAAVRARLSPDRRAATLRDVAALLVGAEPADPTEPGTWASWSQLAPHVLAAAAFCEELVPPPPGLIPLLRHIACYFQERASFRAARDALETALRLAEGVGTHDVLVGELQSDLGELLDLQGDLGAAIARHELAVAVLERSLSREDVRVAWSRARLGHCLNCAGDPHGAVRECHQALVVLRAAGEPSETARVLVELGYAHWATHALQPAADAFTEALHLLRASGRGDHALAAAATAGLGTVRQDQGDLHVARALHEQGLAMLQRIHGKDHPDIGQFWDKLGYVLRLLGDPAASVAAHRRAEEMLAATLGPADPRVGMALTNLGLALAAAGDAAGAREAQERARDIFVAAYGEEHPHTHLANRRLAVALLDAGAPEAARALARAELEHARRALGDDDRELGNVRSDLAPVLGASASR
ncbi:FxSxx-COOH system tetratricopeptide repeat protein [Geodermatophilus sp. URMC 60]